MKHPRIQISGVADHMNNYIQAVRNAGGLPFEGYAPEPDLTCDGLLLCGGGDIVPALYGRDDRGSDLLDPVRDQAELRLVEDFLRAGRPILGVCRGIQVLNTVLGGTLYQDISSQYKTTLSHQMPEPPYNRTAHPFRVVEGTPLAGLSPAEGVNSRHHQAVLDLAPGLEVMAYAADGIIEAVWMPEKRFVWAVQWHPEAYWEEDGLHIELFQKLVEAAK